MMRGLFSGSIWGVAIGGGAIAVLSLIGGKPVQTGAGGDTVQLVDDSENLDPAVMTDALAAATAPSVTDPDLFAGVTPDDVVIVLPEGGVLIGPEDIPEADIGPQDPLLPEQNGEETGVGDSAEADQDAAMPLIDDAAATVVTIVPEASGGLPTGDSRVRVNRFGRDTADAVPATPAVQAADPAPIDPDAPAIVRYGNPVANPDDKPAVSIVLIDDGSFNGAVPALAGVPFPVTVVLNPSSPDATEKMKAYRAAGIEVGVLARLPEGARPADAEVFFEAAFSILPETVAVVDVGDGGLQGNSISTIQQAISAVRADGRGLVTVSRGLNTTAREAQRAGVPTRTVFRDLDSNGQDAQVISRFIDQAAFRARQESGVLLLGRVRADTISALSLWGTTGRAGQVALVPVTQVLETP